MAKRETSSVTLRLKPLSNGREHYYLDIYVKGKRSYEFLPLYKIRATDEETRNLNENALTSAKAWRNRRELEIIQQVGGIKKTDDKLLLTDWLEQFKLLKMETGQSDGRSLSVGKLISHIKKYKGDKLRLCDVDADFCRGFVKYLSTAKSGKHTVNEKTLSKSTAGLYFSILTTALNEAVRKKKISVNPISELNKEDRSLIRAKKATRPYLSIEEVKLLMKGHCSNREVERAFLFGCFTGIRLSDIRNLRWDAITITGKEYRLSFVMQKTQDSLTLKLNKQAVKCLPKRNGIYVFNLPLNDATINNALKSWAKRSGVKKNISFHVSRHTFATMELTMGADLYVVSKLLGHKNISVTQVYADIIDKKREEAVDKLDEAF